MLLSLLLLAAPSAADLEQGWFLADSGRGQEAAALASEALRADPAALEAHRLYLWSMLRDLHDGPALEAQYRAWVEREPANETARTALAILLGWRNEEPGPWCQEIQALAEPLPARDYVRFQALRARYEAGLPCDWEQAADRQVLIALSQGLPEARGYGLQLRLVDQPVDQRLQDDLAAFYLERPRDLRAAAALWGDEPEGPRVEQARADALEAARRALSSSDVVQVHAALHVFRAAEDQTGIGAAAKRCQELDPVWRGPRQAASIQAQWAMRKEQPWSPLLARVDRARRKALADVAVRELRDLERLMPKDGLTRAYYQEALAQALERAGKDKAALQAYYDGWQAEPGNGSMANAYAYTAALQNRDLGKALQAINTALIELAAYDPQADPSVDGYEAWLEKMAHLTAARLDTRAWILHLLGHDEEAAADLRRALLVSREAEPLFDLHLGLVYADLGMEPQALEHLGRGLAMGASEEPATDAEAREVAEGLFSKLRWAVGGFDDWLATRLPDRFRGAEPLPPEHLNVGATFPDLPVRVDGEDLALSDFPGLRVIDVWASTCDACTATLDAYNRVASAWEGRGFHFLLLSVDDRRWQVESFWEDAPPRSFDVAWAGEGALEELDLPGLSTVFIVDEDGKVLACIPRYRGEQDGRLAQRLEALVRPPAP